MVVNRSRTYDVVVVGLGIMGAATLYHLSKAGLRVLGVEAHGPAHTMGSSHGDTRIFRRAYWEGERYLPLLDCAYDEWLALNEFGCGIVSVKTGGLFVGKPSSTLVRGSSQTALNGGVPHTVLRGTDIRRRFPAFHADDMIAVYEPDALMLFADTARLTYLTHAVAHGAKVEYGSPIRKISDTRTPVVASDDWQVECGAVVLTVGSWIAGFLPEEIGPYVTPMRIPVYHFDVEDDVVDDHGLDRFPVFLYEDEVGGLVYGFPKWRATHGIKIGFHNRQLSPLQPGEPRRSPSADERHELQKVIRAVLPGVSRNGSGTACVYSMSTDECFLMGKSKERMGVYYASVCSGHGFKFAPSIGRALADLITDGRSSLPIEAFDSARLTKTA